MPLIFTRMINIRCLPASPYNVISLTYEIKVVAFRYLLLKKKWVGRQVGIYFYFFFELLKLLSLIVCYFEVKNNFSEKPKECYGRG